MEFTQNPAPADIKYLTQGLADYADEMRQQKPQEDFAFFLRDEQDKIIAGCNGIIYYGCMYVDQLWVDAAHRGQNHGSKLLREAEDYAKRKGCFCVTLDTMDWEALGFYKKQGYDLEFERRDYVGGAMLFFLIRKL